MFVFVLSLSLFPCLSPVLALTFHPGLFSSCSTVMLASNRLIMSLAYTYTLPAYLILCPCFISRRKPARGKKKKRTCATGIAMCAPVYACVCVCVRAQCCTYIRTYVCMYSTNGREKERQRERDIGRASSCLRAGKRRRKRRIRGTERERESERGYARFYRIGGTPELRARRRFVLSPFCSFSLALRRTFRPAVSSLSLSLSPVCLFRPFPSPCVSLAPSAPGVCAACKRVDTRARVYLTARIAAAAESFARLVSERNQSCANENSCEW